MALFSFLDALLDVRDPVERAMQRNWIPPEEALSTCPPLFFTTPAVAAGRRRIPNTPLYYEIDLRGGEAGGRGGVQPGEECEEEAVAERGEKEVGDGRGREIEGKTLSLFPVE